MFEIYPEMSSSDAKAERGFLRKVIAFLGAVCFFLLFALAATWPTKANALPIAQTVTQDGQKIVLTDEECRLDAVKNLKHRATWTENGKVYEGCYGVHPAGVVLGYFADKTVVMIPVQTFTQVIGV